ncbi:hypothetical protein ACWCYL_42605 [Streptomyces sp. 900105755]
MRSKYTRRIDYADALPGEHLDLLHEEVRRLQNTMTSSSAEVSPLRLRNALFTADAE